MILIKIIRIIDKTLYLLNNKLVKMINKIKNYRKMMIIFIIKIYNRMINKCNKNKLKFKMTK